MYCADCGWPMRQVSYIFDREEYLLATIYQCPECKRIEVEKHWDTKKKERPFEIQRFVKTNEPVETVAYATEREEANEKWRKAIKGSPRKAFRLIQIICDFTTMEES